MKIIDFYLVKEAPITECYRFICRLTDKAYQQQKKIYLHVNSAQEAQTIDDLLWTFRDDGFIPHQISEQKTEPATPIRIGYDSIPQLKYDVLINLTRDIPEFFSKFARVLEIVPNDDASRTVARKKYKLYREQNCELKTHNLIEQDKT